jgi:hypothetical protein
MTDREQVILKAIAHAGRGAPAEISKVIKAVGYPKATTKKTLVELSDRGIVDLYRHDYPSSLAPAERKLMIRLKGEYYSAVSVRKKNPRDIVYKAEIRADSFRVYEKGHPHNNSSWIKYNSHSEPIASAQEARREAADFIKLIKGGVLSLRNPKGQHLPGLPAKAQREYEHVLKSELAMGRTVKRAKQIAAGKVRKDYGGKKGRKRNTTVIKARKVIIRKVINPRRRGNVSARKMPAPKLWRVKPTSWGGVDWQAQLQPGDPEAYKRQFASPGAFDSYLIDYFGFRFAKKAMAALARSKGDYVGEGLDKFRNPKRPTSKKATRRNSARFNSTQWANEMARLRDIKPRPLVKMFGKSGGSPEQRAKWESEMREWNRQYRHASKMQKITLAEDNEAFRVRQKQNPRRKRNLDHRDSTHQVQVSKHWRAGGLSQWQRAHKAGQHDLFAHGIKARNPKKGAPAGSSKWVVEQAGKAKRRGWSAEPTVKEIVNHLAFGGGDRGDIEKFVRPLVERAYGKKTRNVAVSRNTKSPTKARAGASRHGRKVAKSGKRPRKRNATPLTSLVKKAVKAVKKAVKRNPLIQPGRRYKMKSDYEPTAVIEAGMRGGFKAVFIAKDGLAGQVGGFNTRQEATAWAKAQGFKVVQKTKKRNPPKARQRMVRFCSVCSRTVKGKTCAKHPGAWVEQIPASKAQRNPSPASIRKNFAGQYSGNESLSFPDGTPQGLAKLGRLVSIKTESGTIKPVKGAAWLCSDTRGKLHIGTPTKGHVLFSGPAHDYGKVREIEYQESKPHLGYKNQTLFFHKLGEETGVKPRLVTDGRGGAKFVGGAYKIKREGIIN